MDTITFEVNVITSIGKGNKKFCDTPANVMACAKAWADELQAFITNSEQDHRIKIERVEIVFPISEFNKVVA